MEDVRSFLLELDRVIEELLHPVAEDLPDLLHHEELPLCLVDEELVWVFLLEEFYVLYEVEYVYHVLEYRLEVGVYGPLHEAVKDAVGLDVLHDDRLNGLRGFVLYRARVLAHLL